MVSTNGLLLFDILQNTMDIKIIYIMPFIVYIIILVRMIMLSNVIDDDLSNLEEVYINEPVEPVKNVELVESVSYSRIN